MTTPLPILLVCAVLFLLSNARPEGGGPSSPMVPDPVISQQMREFKTEVIKSRILSEVNLPEPPLITTPLRLPQSIIDLLVRKEVEDSVIGEGENLITYPLQGNSTCSNKTSCIKFEFELPSDSKPVSSIHIWVRKFLLTDSLTVSSCFSLSLEEEQECEYEETLNKVKSEMGWDIFELSPKYIFELRTDQSFCTINVVGSSVQDYGDQKPFLVANINPGAADRKRRSANANKNCTCCLIDFYVSFKEIGWHWVVAPLGFSANMCYGKCSTQINSYPSHYHRMLSTILNNKTATADKKEALWTPCCSPTKLSPLNMIYVAGNNTNSNSSSSFIYHKIPDMITESCGCW